MIDRIKRLMTEKKLSSTQFSEEVGIQRSALSHVLSGRNKPSLDFMMKIKNRYQDINLDWLLLGKGIMVKEEVLLKQELGKSPESETQPEINFFEGKQMDNSIKDEIDIALAEKTIIPSESAKPIMKTDRKLKYVLLMYEDNTFETFNREK